MRHPALAFFLALALPACGSPKMTREDMESWDGKSFRQLVEAWGVPDRQQTFEGKRYYFWTFQGTQGSSVSVPDVEGSSRALGKGTGYHTESTRAFCDRTAQVNDSGVVEHVTWDGNSCQRYRHRD
jgi:hypothetical protein